MDDVYKSDLEINIISLNINDGKTLDGLEKDLTWAEAFDEYNMFLSDTKWFSQLVQLFFSISSDKFKFVNVAEEQVGKVYVDWFVVFAYATSPS